MIAKPIRFNFPLRELYVKLVSDGIYEKQRVFTWYCILNSHNFRMIQIFLYFFSLFWIFSIVAARSCSMRPMPVMNNYKEKFDTPVDLNNVVDVTCNDTLTWELEMKPLRFTAKNISDDELCRIWLPGGIQMQFISSELTYSDVRVLIVNCN